MAGNFYKRPSSGGQSNGGQYQKRPAAAADQGQKQQNNGEKPNYIFSTGLFAPKKEGVKAIGGVQVSENVTIPAGAYIDLYENDPDPTLSPEDQAKRPRFRLLVKPPRAS